MTPAGSGRAKSDPRSWPVRRTESYGGVVVRPSSDGPLVALIRPRSDDPDGKPVWALPKGAKDAGESAEAAALREVVEETGLQAEVVEALEPFTYWFAWAPEQVRYRKTVHFFLMRCDVGDPRPDGFEVAEVAFVPLRSAHKKASYGGEKTILKAAAARVDAW